MRELGELAFRTAYPHDCDDWHEMTPTFRADWVEIESAIRADEAAKVRTSTIEECAKVCRDYALLMIGRNDTKQCGKIIFEIERAILDNHKEETS
jgi:hypothetical protein